MPALTSEAAQEMLAEIRAINKGEKDYGPSDDKKKAKAKAHKELTSEARKPAEKEAKAHKAEMAALREEFESFKAKLHDQRAPSKAGLIGQGQGQEPGGRRKLSSSGKAHPFMKSSFRGYKAGELFEAMAEYKCFGEGGFNPEVAGRGKAKLEELAAWEGVPSMSAGSIGKATLGASNANGGYVLPNNLVDDVIKPNVQEFFYPDLITIRTGVNVRGVDQPYRTGAPSRALAINWGALKTNVDEAYGSYTATLGTFAKIYDLGKQYMRFSAGSAETDVLDELAKSFFLAEKYSVIAGPGTGAATPGVNDPTLGIYTALAADAPTYSTTFSGASASTLLGSAVTAFTQMLKALAKRSRTANAIVTDSDTYWSILAEGSDTAGNWAAPLVAGGVTRPGFNVDTNGILRFWGVPLYFDSDFDTNTSTTKAAIAGDWKALKMFRGSEFRVDTTDIAGTRWDYNLVGFRGEAEWGINAYAAAAVGAFQLGTAIIP
jgi:HK97 family phage major capsid protein